MILYFRRIWRLCWCSVLHRSIKLLLVEQQFIIPLQFVLQFCPLNVLLQRPLFRIRQPQKVEWIQGGRMDLNRPIYHSRIDMLISFNEITLDVKFPADWFNGSKNAAQIEFQCSLVNFGHSSKTALCKISQPERSASKPQFTSRSSEMPACILSTTHPSSKVSKVSKKKRNPIH